MDRTVDTSAQTAMYGGSVSGLAAWGLQLSDVAAIISALVAIIGLVVHIWATVRKNARAEEAHRAYMEGMRGATTDERDRASAHSRASEEA